LYCLRSILECNRAERRKILTQCHTHTRTWSQLPFPHCDVFILGIYTGEYPPKVLYSPAKKNLLLQQKASKPPDPLNRGSAPGPHWGNSPQTPSSDVHPLVSTVSGHPQFLTVCCQNIVCKCVKSFSFWDFFPIPPTATLLLDHTGELLKFLCPSSPSCIQWQCIPLFQSTVVGCVLVMTYSW